MESELERLQLEVKGALYRLTVNQLIRLSNTLQISGPGKEHITGKTRNYLISHVIKHTEREALMNLEDEGLSELLAIKDMIDDIQKFDDSGECEHVNQTEEQENLQREVEALRLSLQQKESEMHELVNKRVNQQTNYTVPLPHHNKPWHKDFKISGQIGEPGQKDRLNFSSLARQIESGLSRGYSELEIIDAVIRAIVPGLQLRSYLEGKENLTLPTLRRILRSHYQEKSATELYKQLTSEVQSSKETPQNFLIRAMDLRQKILFASQEVESSLKYDPALVQSLFMHTVLTGLHNDNIKSDLQPYLLQTSTSDELLLERVNIACANEKERQEKKRHAAPPRATNINTVQSCETTVEKKSATQPSPPMLSPDLLSELKEIRSDMVLLKDLRAEVSQIRESIQSAHVSPHHFGSNKGPENTSAPYHVFMPPQHPSVQNEPKTVPYYSQQIPGTVQEYRPAPGPGLTRETTQFQQRFAPQRYYPVPRPRPRCYSCTQRGEEYCQHCFKCGSSEHFRAGCRAQREAKPARDIPLNK